MPQARSWPHRCGRDKEKQPTNHEILRDIKSIKSRTFTALHGDEHTPLMALYLFKKAQHVSTVLCIKVKRSAMKCLDIVCQTQLVLMYCFYDLRLSGSLVHRARQQSPGTLQDGACTKRLLEMTQYTNVVPGVLSFSIMDLKQDHALLRASTDALSDHMSLTWLHRRASSYLVPLVSQ